MCREAPKVVYELEHFGMPFDRNPDGTILPAPVRRPLGQLWREAGAARVRGRGPHRARAAAHPVPAQRRVAPRSSSSSGWRSTDPQLRRRRRRRDRDRDGDRRADDLRGEGHGARHRRRRPYLRRVDQRLHQHRRRPRARRPRGHAARGHGVLAVPPDRRGRGGRPDHRRCARRGRHPAQLERRALHGALRADAEGPGAARLRVPLDGPGDQGRARLWSEQGPRAAEARPSRRRDDHETAAVDSRDRDHVRQRRSDP